MTDIVINNIIAYLNNFTIYIYKELNMKKLLLASLITATSFGASANAVITFDDSSFGGSGVTFNALDFNFDVATVSQTDTDTNGNASGLEAFSEFGTTDLVNFLLTSSADVAPSAYEIFFDYSFSGFAEYFASTPFGEITDVNFNAGAGALYVDQFADGNFLGEMDANTIKIADMSFRFGDCLILNPTGNASGSCNVFLDVDFAPGYFSTAGTADLSTSDNVISELTVTVQDVVGFSPVYGSVGDTQTFEISHDGNMSFDVPEPASVAILGLGLLGFAGARRRKS